MKDGYLMVITTTETKRYGIKSWDEASPSVTTLNKEPCYIVTHNVTHNMGKTQTFYNEAFGTYIPTREVVKFEIIGFDNNKK